MLLLYRCCNVCLNFSVAHRTSTKRREKFLKKKLLLYSFVEYFIIAIRIDLYVSYVVYFNL